MTQREDLQSILADGSVRRASALRAAGIRPQAIADALSAGIIARTGTGAYYQPRAAVAPGLVSIAAACSRMPQAVVCLMSAAWLSDLIEEPPKAIWLALPLGLHEAKEGDMPQRLVRWSYAGAFKVGVVEKEICGVPVRCMGPARTIVDFLRYGRRLGDPTMGIVAARRFVAAGWDIDDVLDVADELGVPEQVDHVLKTLATVLGQPNR